MTSTLRKRDLKRCCAEGSSRAVRARHQAQKRRPGHPAFKRNDGHPRQGLETGLQLMVNLDVLQSVRRVGVPGPVVSFLAIELESNIEAMATAIPRSVLFADLCQIVPYAASQLTGVNAPHLRELRIF